MREILIVVGFGCAGFSTAWGLAQKPHPGEARVTVVDPRPYPTCQPFLPEGTAGSIEARHAVVSSRRHSRSARLIADTVTGIRNAERTATARPVKGAEYKLPCDIRVAVGVFCAGMVCGSCLFLSS